MWDRELRDVLEKVQTELRKARERADKLEALLAAKTVELEQLKRRPLEPKRPRGELLTELVAAKRRMGRLEVQLAERVAEVATLKAALVLALRARRVRRS